MMFIYGTEAELSSEPPPRTCLSLVLINLLMNLFGFLFFENLFSYILCVLSARMSKHHTHSVCAGAGRGHQILWS